MRSVAKGSFNKQPKGALSCNGFHKGLCSGRTTAGAIDGREAGLANVLVISDDAATCDPVVSCLAADGHMVAACRASSAAPRLFAMLSFHAVYLDTAVSQSSIDDFLSWLQSDRERAAPPVLFFLPLGSQWTSAAAPPQLRPGLDGCLVKPLDGDSLKKTVAELLARSARGLPAHPHVLRSLPFVLDSDTHELSAGGKSVALTPTEYRLLSYLMAQPEAVISPETLLENVWGFHPGTGAASVVRVHVSSLRRKMAALGHAHLLETLPHRGYRLLQEKRG
jgi:two-component system, OmpR family, response regulator